MSQAASSVYPSAQQPRGEGNGGVLGGSQQQRKPSGASSGLQLTPSVPQPTSATSTSTPPSAPQGGLTFTNSIMSGLQQMVKAFDPSATSRQQSSGGGTPTTTSGGAPSGNMVYYAPRQMNPSASMGAFGLAQPPPSSSQQQQSSSLVGSMSSGGLMQQQRTPTGDLGPASTSSTTTTAQQQHQAFARTFPHPLPPQAQSGYPGYPMPQMSSLPVLTSVPTTGSFGSGVGGTSQFNPYTAGDTSAQNFAYSSFRGPVAMPSGALPRQLTTAQSMGVLPAYQQQQFRGSTGLKSGPDMYRPPTTFQGHSTAQSAGSANAAAPFQSAASASSDRFLVPTGSVPPPGSFSSTLPPRTAPSSHSYTLANPPNFSAYESQKTGGTASSSVISDSTMQNLYCRLTELDQSAETAFQRMMQERRSFASEFNKAKALLSEQARQVSYRVTAATSSATADVVRPEGPPSSPYYPFFWEVGDEYLEEFVVEGKEKQRVKKVGDFEDEGWVIPVAGTLRMRKGGVYRWSLKIATKSQKRPQFQFGFHGEGHSKPWRLVTTSRCSLSSDDQPWVDRPGGDRVIKEGDVVHVEVDLRGVSSDASDITSEKSGAEKNFGTLRYAVNQGEYETAFDNIELDNLDCCLMPIVSMGGDGCVVELSPLGQ